MNIDGSTVVRPKIPWTGCAARRFAFPSPCHQHVQSILLSVPTYWPKSSIRILSSIHSRPLRQHYIRLAKLLIRVISAQSPIFCLWATQGQFGSNIRRLHDRCERYDDHQEAAGQQASHDIDLLLSIFACVVCIHHTCTDVQTFVIAMHPPELRLKLGQSSEPCAAVPSCSSAR